MSYADSDYYKSVYHGAMSDADFERLSRKASAYLDSLTFGRIKDDWTGDARVKDACCAVAEQLYQQEQGGEIASESTGGWSRSYVTAGKTAAASLRDTARRYLSNTGLLYRGVDI